MLNISMFEVLQKEIGKRMKLCNFVNRTVQTLDMSEFVMGI